MITTIPIRIPKIIFFLIIILFISKVEAQTINESALSINQVTILKDQPNTPLNINFNKSSVVVNGCINGNNAFEFLSVTATGLSADVVATAPPGVVVSLDNNTYQNSITIPQTGGNINTTIYIAAATTTVEGAVSGNIIFSSNGSTKNLPVTANNYLKPVITLGSISPVLTTATSFTIPLTYTGSPSQFTIQEDFNGTPMPGFTSIFGALSGNQITVPIPTSATGSYDFLLAVYGKCYSDVVPVNLLVTTTYPVLNVGNNNISLDGCTGRGNNFQTVNISGSNLTSNVVITPPVGIEISINNTWSNSLTLTPANGIVNQSLYIRIKGNAQAGDISGDINITSNGAASATIHANAINVQTPDFTLGSINNISTTATSFNIPITITAGVPDYYEVYSSTPNPLPGASYFTGSISPTLNIPIPASAPGNYNFSMSIGNNQCASIERQFILKILSSDADISSLYFITGRASHSFSPVPSSYASSVVNDFTSIDFNATPRDHNATIKINNQLVGNSLQTTFPLNIGLNTFNIVCTAEDGVTAKSYTFNITRANGATSIDAFVPTTGTAGDVISITGLNFTGATDVTFGGRSATSFTVINDKAITAKVNNNSASGNIQVINPATGTATVSGFVYTSPLPLTFISFKSNVKNSGIELLWQVADAIDAKEYQVERSSDGAHFSVIATVPNNHQSSASWLDIQPLKGNSYYRIRSLSLSNNSNIYSDILKVSNGNTKATISIFPNPVVGKSFTANIEGLQPGVYQLSVLNSNMREVYSKSFSYADQPISTKIALLKTAPAGLYILKVSGISFNKSIPFIINK